MVSPINKEYALQAPVQNYFADDVTGGTWPITTNDISGGQAYKIALLNNSATDHSAKTVIYIGLGPDGKSQTETIFMPAGTATVLSTLYYSSLISATPSATIGADTMDIGFTSQFATPTIPMDYGSIGSLISVNFVGTMTYSVESTADNIQTKSPPFSWLDAGDPFIAATASQQASNSQAPRALRVAVASYTGTPIFEFSILQASNRG